MPEIHAFLGMPLLFKDDVYVYPPKIKDGITENFGRYQSVLLLSQEELEDMFGDRIKTDSNFVVPTPFEFLLINCYNDKSFEQLAKESFQFFIKQNVTFLYEQKLILIGNLEGELLKARTLDDLTFLDEQEYFNFQNIIRVSLGQNPIKPPDANMHPKKKRMLALARLRDRVKAKQNAKKGLTFDNMIVAICCMGLGINPLNIGELSYCAVNSLIECYQNKEKYELDIQSLLAGADSKKVHPQYWIGDLK